MRKALVTTLLLLVLICTVFVGLVNANPNIMITGNPPIVSATFTKTDCSIYNINGQPWASVEIVYSMKTIHSYGDTFEVPYSGQHNIVTNKLEAHYPMPLSAKNINIQINNQEINWQYDTKGFIHIFDSNLPTINWTIQPVPKTFDITVHYEQPIPSTSLSNSYLGQYALVLPLIPRFGSTDTPSFPLYSWFDYGITSSIFSIQNGLDANLIDGYLIALNGSLSKAEYSTINSQGMQFQIKGVRMLNFPEQQSFPHGAVITINDEVNPTPSPTTSPTPSPSVPEISWLTILSILLAIPIVLVIVRKKLQGNVWL
jgi:hypothetical protein